MISFINTYKSYWLNSFNIKKLSSRDDYRIAIIGNILIVLVTWNLKTFFNPITSTFLYKLFTNFPFYFLLTTIIPQISITIRRFKDINKKWDWIFLSLHPAGNLITVIWLFFENSKAVRNIDPNFKGNKFKKIRFFLYGLFLPFIALIISIPGPPIVLFLTLPISLFILLPKAYKLAGFNKNKVKSLGMFLPFLFGTLTIFYWLFLFGVLLFIGIMGLTSMLAVEAAIQLYWV